MFSLQDAIAGKALDASGDESGTREMMGLFGTWYQGSY